MFNFCTTVLYLKTTCLLRGECRAKGDFSRLWTDFDAFFLFESYLECKSKEVRNNEISLGEFLKNPKIFSKDSVRQQIDLSLRTSWTSFFFET